jgi:hypothetical protein
MRGKERRGFISPIQTKGKAKGPATKGDRPISFFKIQTKPAIKTL